MHRSATAISRKPRIAIIISEGAERDANTARRPKDLDVGIFDAARANSVADSVRTGVLDYVVLANKRPNSGVIQKLPKGTRLFYWTRSIVGLPSALHTVIGLARPRSEDDDGGVDAVSNDDEQSPSLEESAVSHENHWHAIAEQRRHPGPYVTVAEASARPERRPPWTDEQRDALIVAYESSVDMSKFFENYLELTQELDAPVRSQKEIRDELKRLRDNTASSSGFEVYAFLAQFQPLAAIALIAARSLRTDSRADALTAKFAEVKKHFAVLETVVDDVKGSFDFDHEKRR